MQETQEQSKTGMTRLEAFCKAFGWAGGTIHQVEEITGCGVCALTGVENQTANKNYESGFLAAKAGQVKDAMKELVFKGNLQFWLGVAGFFIAQEAFKDVPGSFAQVADAVEGSIKHDGPFKCLLKSKAPGQKTFLFENGNSRTRNRVKARPFNFKNQADFDGFMAEVRADNPGWEFKAEKIPV